MKYITYSGIAIVVTVLSFIINVIVNAQDELAATLEVLSSGVEVQRVNTANYIPITVEAIVGVGDTIRTDETGSARITFFADGTDVTLETNTEYRIVEFQADDEDFYLTLEVLAGQTTHRLNRALGANSKYDVETPGMTLAARGTVFAIRVEETGRSGMLVFEGDVDAGAEDTVADVPVGFGVRSEVGHTVSDVVRATTFAELDAALDGCAISIATVDDVSLNVRLGPSIDKELVGYVVADDINIVLGTSEDGNWYRLLFNEGYGWILSNTATIDPSCAGLRSFENTHTEDLSLHDGVNASQDGEESSGSDVETDETGD